MYCLVPVVCTRGEQRGLVTGVLPTPEQNHLYAPVLLYCLISSRNLSPEDGFEEPAIHYNFSDGLNTEM